MGRPSQYSPEFREQAVEMVPAVGRTIAEVARDLSIDDTTLVNRLHVDDVERGVPHKTGCCR
jgi:transposase